MVSCSNCRTLNTRSVGETVGLNKRRRTINGRGSADLQMLSAIMITKMDLGFRRKNINEFLRQFSKDTLQSSFRLWAEDAQTCIPLGERGARGELWSHKSTLTFHPISAVLDHYLPFTGKPYIIKG
ncbi:hypothetical protein J6590_049555 [Homalodisca vitripennis]|nr:hypothetical protein J6590_049555 [Homalodisca vitripennis]